MPNETRKKRRILPWVTISLSVFAGAVAAFLLTMPLDLSRYNDRIESAIEARVNGDVELGRVILKVLPSPELTLYQIKARYKEGELFSADRLYARVKLLPLLSGRTSFEAIEARRPVLFLVRDRNGALNLNEFLKKEKPPEEKPSEPPKEEEKKILIDSLQVDGGRFVFIDRFPMQTASFDITGITASSTLPDKGMAFTASGTLQPSTPVSLYGLVSGPVIEGQAIVEDLSLLPFNPYIRQPGARVEGRVDLDISYIFDKTLITRTKLDYRDIEASYPSVWEKPLVSPSGSGFVTLKTARGLFDLAVDDITLNMGSFTVQGTLSLVGPKRGKSMDLNASTTPVEAARFLSLLPVRKMSPAVAEKVRAIKPLGGTATIEDLRLAGKLKELKGTGILDNPQVTATLLVNKASFIYKDLKAPFTGVSGRLSYRDRTLSFSDLTGRYSRQILDRLSGQIKNLSGDGQFKIRAEGSLDVEDTLALAESRAKGALKEGLSALDANGVASISADVSGSLKRSEPFKYSGETILRNGSAYYRGVPIGFDSLDAAVAFDNDRITVKEASARTDSSSIALTGSVEGYRGGDPHFSFQSKGALTAETLNKAVGKGPETLNITGAVPFTASAEGRKKDFRAKAAVDATQSGVFIDKYLDKAPGFAFKAEAEGSLRGAEANIGNARVDFGASVVQGSGSKTLGAPVYSASLMSEQLRIADLDEISPYLDRGYASSGMLSFNVKTMKGPGQASASYDGSVKITDGSFDTGLIGSPVHNINAAAEFGGNKAGLVIERLETGSTVLEGRVDVLDMAERTVRFDLNFPKLHAEDLMPRKREKKAENGKKQEEPEAEPEKRKPVTGSGSIRAVEGDLWKHQFKSLSADILFINDMITVNPVSLDIDGGKASASATIFLAADEPRLFIADINANGLNFEQVVEAKTKRKFLSGTANGRIRLTGLKGDAPFARRLNGNATLVVEGGRFWKFGFITDVFSFVNIISIDELFKSGLPYKDITGTFTMNRGIISTSDLAFDSDSLRMSAIGRLQMPENTIDLTLALHPFVTIDRIIKNIPIFGWIITGKEESTVSFYFDIEGPASKPDITPLPIKTIEKGVLGILQRLLNPFKWFD